MLVMTSKNDKLFQIIAGIKLNFPVKCNGPVTDSNLAFSLLMIGDHKIYSSNNAFIC